MAERIERDPFYVGYLPLPAAIKRFIMPWLVGNFVLAIGIAAVIAQQHREPGDGTWDTSEPITVYGWIETYPYAILKTKERTYILVEQGKLGAGDRIKSEQGQAGWAKVTGYLVERDGRHVLELDGSRDKPIVQVSKAPPQIGGIHDDVFDPLAPAVDLGAHTLRGEIVDPKCYLGVMQPGDGKTHKVCATLCIKGGIPPMLLVRDRKGKAAAYLLTDSEGKAFPDSHHEYIADPIEITGQVLRDGDLLILRADLDSIRRLEP